MPQEARQQIGGAVSVVRNALIVIELVAGVGAVAAAVLMLVVRKPEALRDRSLRLLAKVLLAVAGAILVCAAALLLGGVSQARLISVEGGVFFTGWVAGHLALAGARHWMQFLALALGVAVVVLALMLPCPG